MTKWISVKDKLPEENARILIFYMKNYKSDRKNDAWKITIAHFSGGNFYFLNQREKSMLSHRVRYWMPLPERPRKDYE